MTKISALTEASVVTSDDYLIVNDGNTASKRISVDKFLGTGLASGDVFYWDGTNIANLAKGSNNSILSINGSGTMGWNTALSLDDSAAQFYDSDKATAKAQIDCTDITAGQTSLLTIPDRDGEVVLCDNTFTHDYAGGAVTKAMTAGEARAAFITTSNANGNCELNIPAAIPGKIWLIYNGTGYILTFKVTGQTGGTIANGKYAVYASHASDVIEIMEQA